MLQLVSMKAVAGVGIVLAAGILGAACSSDPDPGTTSGGGEGGEGGATSSSSQSSGDPQSSSISSSSSSGAGGDGGGSGCGDTKTDPENCGECGNPCAPGQTCVAGACTCPASPPAVSFKTDIQGAIFAESCGMNGICHFKGKPSGGLSLKDSATSYAALVNVDSTECDGRKRVIPGEPSESFLVDKLMGVQLCGSSKMPLANSGFSITMAQIETISNWVCAGAPNN